jgi:hypothetical protein
VVSLIEDSGAAGFRLQLKYNRQFDDWAALSEGAYLLRSNLTDWSDERPWKAYTDVVKGPTGDASELLHFGNGE